MSRTQCCVVKIQPATVSDKCVHGGFSFRLHASIDCGGHSPPSIEPLPLPQIRQDEDGKGFTDKEVQDEVTTFTAAGHDTMSSGRLNHNETFTTR